MANIYEIGFISARILNFFPNELKFFLTELLKFSKFSERPHLLQILGT